MTRCPKCGSDHTEIAPPGNLRVCMDCKQTWPIEPPATLPPPATESCNSCLTHYQPEKLTTLRFQRNHVRICGTCATEVIVNLGQALRSMLK